MLIKKPDRIRSSEITYLIGIGGVVHYWMIVKSDVFYPVVFGIVLALLLGYRVSENNKAKKIQSIKVDSG